MATAGELVTRTIQQLLAGTVEERNKLASPVGSTDETLSFIFNVGSIRDNSIFEIGSELCYVWRVNTSTKSAEVERGYAGTAAASHAVNKPVTVNPRFPRAQVLTALNNELTDLCSPLNGLYQMKTVDLSYNGSDRMVNLTGVSNISELYDVRYRYLNDDYPIVKNVRLLTKMPTSDFPSGNVLAFDQDIRSGLIRVLYKSSFGQFSDEATTTTAVGIGEELEDLVVLGAQIRLMAGREIKRNFTESQGDTRRPEEVQSGSVLNSMVGLQRLRRERILAESARLARLYPIRIRK